MYDVELRYIKKMLSTRIQQGSGLPLFFDAIDTDMHHKRWIEWVNAEESEFKEYARQWSEQYGWDHRDRFPIDPTDGNATSGLYTMKLMLEYRPPEMNIIYAGRRKEMVMTVSTEENTPIIAHMGIQRSFSYLNKGYDIHRKISLQLHAFSAYLYSDMNKLYVLTRPVKQMREILVNALKDIGGIYVGTNLWHARNELKLIDYVRKHINGYIELENQMSKLAYGPERTKLSEKIYAIKQSAIKEYEKTLQQMADSMPLKHPVREIIYPSKKLLIYDKQRQNVIFEYDYQTQTGQTSGIPFTNGYDRFRWLVSGHMWIDNSKMPLIAIDVDMLTKLYNTDNN